VPQRLPLLFSSKSKTASSKLGSQQVLRREQSNPRNQMRYGQALKFESRVEASGGGLLRGTHSQEVKCCCPATPKMLRFGLLQGTGTRLVHPRPRKKFSKDESKCSVGTCVNQLFFIKRWTYLTSLRASMIARVPTQPSSVHMWKRVGISCSSVKRSYLSLIIWQTGTSYSLHFRR